ncbi:MAG: trypsin-like peptidase domain-containing protein [Pseudobdellovibrionaceae bacterium]
MRLFIRMHGHPCKEVTLDPNKQYTIGRGSGCDFQIPHPEVSRKQGRIFFQKDCWIFKDESAEIPRFHDLNDNCAAYLKNGLEILIEDYLDNEPTKIGGVLPNPTEYSTFEAQKRKSKWLVPALGAFALIFIISGSLHFYKTKMGRYDSQTMMGFAENKVVKFELKFKEDHIKKIKQDGQFKDEDFKNNIGFCTGFVVAPNVLLTAHHCLSMPGSFSIMEDFNIVTVDNKQIQPVKILGYDFVKDYLFLEVTGLEDAETLKFVKKTEIGEKVFTIGNVAGEGLAIREGIIAGETEDPNDPQIKYIRFSAAASPGNSGGPLLNEKGEIVALVSKKNFAENYNIGIHHKDLKSGLEQFVMNPEPKTISFSSADNGMELADLSYVLPRTFGLKMGDALAARADLSKKFRDFKVELPVPFEYKDHKANYLNVFAKQFKSIITEVETETIINNLPGTSWENQATKDFPLIAPVVAEEKSMSFKLLDENLIVPLQTGLIGHSGFYGYNAALNEWKKSKTYNYSDGYMAQRVSLIEHRFENSHKSGYLVYSSIADVREPQNLTGMLYASPDLSISYLKDFSQEEKEKVLLGAMKNVFFSKEGSFLNLKYFPFLRPKASSEFKIMDFPTPVRLVNRFKDNYDREWKYYVADLYGTLYIEFFCHDFSAKTHCLTVMKDGDFEKADQDLAANYVRSEFSEKIPMIDFFEPKDLQAQNFGSRPDLKNLKVSTFSNRKFNYTGLTNNSSLTVNSQTDIVYARPISAIYKNEEEPPKWVQLGMNFLRKAQSSSKERPQFEFCTTGTELEKYKYNAYLKVADSEMTRMVASISSSGTRFPASVKENFWKKFVGIKENRDFLYGSCFPLRENPQNPKTFQVDVFQGKPFSLGQQ